MTDQEKEEFFKQKEKDNALFSTIKEKYTTALLMTVSGGMRGLRGKYIINNELYEFSYNPAYDEKKYNRKIKTLSEKELKKVIRFIKWRLLYWPFISIHVLDASETIYVNYKGKSKEIHNPLGFFEGKGISKKTSNLFEELSK